MKPGFAWLGLSLATLSALTFAANTTSAVLAYQAGATPISVMTVRLIVTIGALYALIRLTGASCRLPPRDRWIALAIGLLLGVQGYTLYKAVEVIPVGLAILSFYLYPLFTGLLSHVVGQERIGWRVASALVLAFAGLALALDVTGDGIDPIGILMAVGSAAVMAVIIVVSASIITRSGDSRPVTFHMHITATIGFVIISLALGELPLPRTTPGWIAFAAIPVFYTIAITAFFAAVRLIGPVKSGLVMNSEPVFSITFGFLVLGQVLTGIQLVGAALVVGAIVVVRLENQPAKEPGEGPG